MNHVVDLDLTVASTGPHDGGIGTVADASGGPEVGEHLPKESPEDIAPVPRRCTISLRAQEMPVDCGYTAVEVLLKRARRRTSDSMALLIAATAETAEADARPAKKPREKAFTDGGDPPMKKSVI